MEMECALPNLAPILTNGIFLEIKLYEQGDLQPGNDRDHRLISTEVGLQK